MYVFDNIVYSLQGSGGVSRFWSKITEPYSDSAYFIERADSTSNLYRNSLKLNLLLPDHRFFKPISRYADFALNFNGSPHIFHSSYYRTNNVPNAINVTTIHDLMYERYVGRGIGSKLHILQKKRSLIAADCIVCVSEHTKRDLYEFYPFTLDKRVEVIPNGVDENKFAAINGTISDKVRETVNTGKYFLYVGHRGRCKGFDRVYQALKLCDSNLSCVIVGNSLLPQEKAEIAAAGLTNRIRPVGRVSDADLEFLYRHAEFFFFPSLYEGFGIPPLEAMGQGCPVLASDRSSIPEVVGEAGAFFDPDDNSSLEEALSRVFSLQTRQELIESGRKRVKEFTWQSAINKYKNLYSGLLNGSL